MGEANAQKVERILSAVNNWRLGSKPMSRDKFLLSVSYLIERLEEMAEEEDGFEWDDED